MKKILLLSIILILAACQAPPADPTRAPASVLPATQTPPATELEEPTPASSPGLEQGQADEEKLEILELVVRDLAQRMQADLNEIQVVSIQEQIWPSAGLGCENPGLAYAQVITPGYLIVLEYEGESHSYHTNTERFYVLCEDGFPQFPLLPADPGEIQDGIPWMPVDPVPTVDPGDTIADPDPVK